MGFPEAMLFLQGMGKMLYEPFRFKSAMKDFSRTPQTVAVFVWTSIIGFFRAEFSRLGLEYINAGIFVFTLLCIMWSEFMISSTKTDRIFERKYVRNLTNLVMYFTLPFVLLFYIWFPIYDRLPCLLKRAFTNASTVDEWKSTTWVVFAAALFLSALYGLVQGLKKPYKFKRRDKFASPDGHTPVTRSMTRKSRSYYY